MFNISAARVASPSLRTTVTKVVINSGEMLGGRGMAGRGLAWDASGGAMA
jgi:hypothetical protein